MLSEEGFALFTKWRVSAFGRKLREIAGSEECDDLTFEEKIGMCIEAELEARDNRKIEKAVRAVKFKVGTACVEEIYYLPDRSLTRNRIAMLASCAWIEARENLVIISESGGVKSYVAQALGVSACRELHSVRYARLNDMFHEINVACSDDSLYCALDRFSTPDLLILDGFFTTPVENPLNAVDLFEILEARVDAHSAPARAGPMVPQDQLRPVRGLDPQPDRGAHPVPGHQGAEHALAHSQAKGWGRQALLEVTGRYRMSGKPLPLFRRGGTGSTEQRY